MSENQVTILGSNSAISVYDRYPSGQVLQIAGETILIDCGEGTQFRMNQYGIRKSKINTILITHLHGDHLFGLPGLLTSYQLAGRKSALRVYGPAPLQQFLDTCLGETGHFIDYPLEVIEIDMEEVKNDGLHLLEENHKLEILTFELIHRIPCFGFLVREKVLDRKIKKDFIETHNPRVTEIKSVKRGEDYVSDDGSIIPNHACTDDPRKPDSYAYCSDTLYHPPLIELLKGVNTIYHESTYLDDLRDKAESRFHSTAIQAANIAKGAGAKQLILGHYSSRYMDIEPFRTEASSVFIPTELAKEGEIFRI